MARLFLTVVGLIYFSLACWCAAAPETTSRAVGFSLQSGSGQSEFLVVYGGLEFGLGLVFLWPLYRPCETRFSLRACLIVHGSLVLFRAISFVLFAGIDRTTYVLAATEWMIFLLSLAVWTGCRQPVSGSQQASGA